MDKNGFFKFTTSGGATYCTITSPEGNGKPVAYEDVVAYLNLKKFSDFDAKELHTQLNEAKVNQPFKISDVEIKNYTAFCDYTISSNGMLVTAKIYPAIGSDECVSVDEIMTDLTVKKIVYGIDLDLINKMVDNRAYNTPFTIASGLAPVEGYDAKIEYLFRTDIKAKPKINDNGTVDYHELDLISKIDAGQIVAKMIPEDPGVPGKNIYGTELSPHHVKKINFKFGKNLYISEDGLSLITKVSGHVMLEGEKIFVSDTYEVPVDVDVTTGDIDYDGNILVRGNVRSGFSLKATGDITVFGVVEGARIECGGNLTINRGVQGMNKAELIVGGDLVSRFIENSVVTCRGDVESDSILHSSVSAVGNVFVKGRNGLIVGGVVKASAVVEAKNIGNEMGTITKVYVGVDPQMRAKIKELQELIKKQTEDKEKLNQVVTILRKKKDLEGFLDPQKTDMLQKSMRNSILIEQEIKKNTEEYKDYQARFTENENSKIRVTGDIFPGVQMAFGNTMYYVKEKRTYCQFVKRGADIVPDLI